MAKRTNYKPNKIVMKHKQYFKGFHYLDMYLYTDENNYYIRRKTWYFYLIPIWVKQYKVKVK